MALWPMGKSACCDVKKWILSAFWSSAGWAMTVGRVGELSFGLVRGMQHEPHSGAL